MGKSGVAGKRQQEATETGIKRGRVEKTKFSRSAKYRLLLEQSPPETQKGVCVVKAGLQQLALQCRGPLAQGDVQTATGREAQQRGRKVLTRGMDCIDSYASLPSNTA